MTSRYRVKVKKGNISFPYVDYFNGEIYDGAIPQGLGDMVAVLHEVYVTQDGYIFDKNGVVILSHSAHFLKKSTAPQCLSDGDSYIVSYDNVINVDSAATVSYDGLTNYYHFYADCLARSIIFDKVLHPSTPLIVPFFKRGFNEVLLNACIGSREKIIVPKGSVFKVCKLYVCKPIRCEKSYNHESAALLLMRSVLLERFNLVHQQPKSSGSKKVYLTRKSVQRRKVLNEADVERYLSALGYEIVQPELLSLKEQASLFSSCDVIVSCSGAALTNIIYCKPTTVIYQLDIGFLNDKPLGMFWTKYAESFNVSLVRIGALVPAVDADASSYQNSDYYCDTTLLNEIA